MFNPGGWPWRKTWSKPLKLILVTGGIVSLSLVTSCTVPAESPEPAPGEADPSSPSFPSPSVEPLPPEMVPVSVGDRVLQQAAEDLQVPRDQLSILRFSKETWQDGCLGLGQPNELCLQALVEGWQIEVVDGTEQSTFYRTDDYGDIIRRSTLDNNLPPSISTQVLRLASTNSGIRIDQLQITAAEPQIWDGCLGIAEPGTACTQIAIYGWQAVVEGNGQTFVYHTDMTGADIRWNNL